MKYRIGKMTAWLLIFCMVLMMLVGCGGSSGAGGSVVAQTGISEVVRESVETAEATSEVEHTTKAEKQAAKNKEDSKKESQKESQKESADKSETKSELDEHGSYNTRDEVALYIHTYGRLPENYITKKQAEKLGWDSKRGNLEEVAPGKSIGGSHFGNYEGQLPEEKGRKYYECDLEYDGGYRGAERIIYSNDGLVFYTGDHYKNFEQLY